MAESREPQRPRVSIENFLQGIGTLEDDAISHLGSLMAINVVGERHRDCPDDVAETADGDSQAFFPDPFRVVALLRQCLQVRFQNGAAEIASRNKRV
jgi:hypothetical protein